MSSRAVTECGVCSGALELVLDLGFAPPPCVVRRVSQPLAPEIAYPVQLMRCVDCTLVQMGCVIDPEIVFPPDYGYSSGNSGALHKNFEELAGSVTVGPDDLVVDIGANDGTLLSKFGECRKVGVEPTQQCDKIVGPAAWHEFFGSDTAEAIVAEFGKARVVTACNVLAHVQDIHDVMDGITRLLADDGVLIAENHDLGSLVNGQWDTAYHEHLRFYSPWSFRKLLERHGLGVKQHREIATHGGSFRTHAARGHIGPGMQVQDRAYDFADLRQQAERSRHLLRAGLAAWRNAGKRIAGIGATARATTIIHYCGLDVQDIEYVCEVSGSDKIGTYMPGTRIPVIDESVLFADQPEAALLFSWHLADAITPSLRAKGFTGPIITPEL